MIETQQMHTVKLSKDTGVNKMNELEIPKTPLRVSATSSGWMPDVALHRYGRRFIHETSYGALVLSGLMFLVALVLCGIPWDERI